MRYFNSVTKSIILNLEEACTKRMKKVTKLELTDLRGSLHTYAPSIRQCKYSSRTEIMDAFTEPESKALWYITDRLIYPDVRDSSPAQHHSIQTSSAPFPSKDKRDNVVQFAIMSS
jgi:hypothetical protein